MTSGGMRPRRAVVIWAAILLLSPLAWLAERIKVVLDGVRNG